MNFYTDRQTIDDLNIFGKKGKKSVYTIFNRTNTKGGAEQLELMFRHPLSDITLINNRIFCIQFFQQQPCAFLSRHELFESVDLYLAIRDGRSKLTHEDGGLASAIRSAVRPDADLRVIRRGIQSLTELLQLLKIFLQETDQCIPATHSWYAAHQEMKRIMAIPEWQPILTASAKKQSFETQVQFDQILRFQYVHEVEKLLHYCSLIDVFISVGNVAASGRFVFPVPVTSQKNVLDLKDLFHPELDKPIANDVMLDEEQNLLFLTGANMAGKSTFMKSVGIAVYLAHMGFPVPAASMQFSVRDGMLSTINLSDNLSMGLSHFYSEVMRVKKVAAALQKGLNMFVLIDELFRGTNVKDAHDATIAVCAGFAKKRNSCFVISTHIMEAGEILKERFSQISFQFLPTRMEGNVPVYPRKLELGISADRHGMIIIHNEGIIEMLNKAAKAILPPQKACHALPC